MELNNLLDLERCPHCGVDRPHLSQHIGNFGTSDHLDRSNRVWSVYVCARCGFCILAYRMAHSKEVKEYFPQLETLDPSIPERAANYLKQAMDSLVAPSGSVILCASAVDAMLRNKGYTTGSLYSRIKKAAEEHLITDEMALWAHQVRIGANDERHPDDAQPLPTIEDAKHAIEFAKALAQFLFVLPSRVAAGIRESQKSAS